VTPRQCERVLISSARGAQMLTFGQAGNRADDLAGTSHSLRSSCPRLTCCVQRPGPCYVPCTTTPRCTLLSPASISSLSHAPFSLPLSLPLSLSLPHSLTWHVLSAARQRPGLAPIQKHPAVVWKGQHDQVRPELTLPEQLRSCPAI